MKKFYSPHVAGLSVVLAFWGGNALAAPVAVAKSAVVAGPTALPALSVSSGTATSYSVTAPSTTSAGTLYVGSTSLGAGTTTVVALADITRLRFVPAASISANTTVTFSYTAADGSGSSAAAAYTLTVVKASTFDFSTRTANEDWTAGRSVDIDNTTLTGSTFTYSANATAHTLAIGNSNNRLPGTALAWGSTYGTTTNPGTDGANNTSTYTFTFGQPVSYLSLTLTDIDSGTLAANNGSDFVDNVTLNAYSAAGSTTAITYDNVSMATVVNSSATPTLARTASTNSVLGTANNNAAANGTVIVSFAGQVQRLVITYKNTAAYTSSNNRIQNMGIPSMTWAYSLSPLPVTLVSFGAKASSNRTGVLTWATASERNNDHFEVERSLDGTHFEAVGTVAGQGTSATAHTYSFTDSTVPTAATLAYYRLRQVDLDGTTTCSPVRSVEFAALGAALVSLYPNPTTGTVMLDLNTWPAGTYQAQVLHLNGQAVTAFTVQGQQLNTLDVQGLPTGCYLLRLASEQGSRTLRLFRQ